MLVKIHMLPLSVNYFYWDLASTFCTTSS